MFCVIHGWYSGMTAMMGCPQCWHQWQQPIEAPRQYPHRCPVCEGRKTVPRNFYSRSEATDGTAPVQCESCNGSGMVWG